MKARRDPLPGRRAVRMRQVHRTLLPGPRLRHINPLRPTRQPQRTRPRQRVRLLRFTKLLLHTRPRQRIRPLQRIKLLRPNRRLRVRRRKVLAANSLFCLIRVPQIKFVGRIFLFRT